MPLWLWITSLLAGVFVFLPEGVDAAITATCTVGGVPYTMINPIALNPSSCPGVNQTGTTGGNIVFNFMETTFCLVRASMGNAMFTMYCALVNAVAPVIRAGLVLYIAIFSIAVLTQIVDGKDWAMRLIKISLIYTFAINPTFFYDYLYNVFVISLPDTLSQYMFAVDLTNTGFQGAGAAGTVEGKRMGVISNLDTMFNLIVGGTELIGYMLLAVAFAVLIIGIPLFWLLLFGFLMALAAFIRVLVAYATALIALSFTLMFAPVFIPMLLFSRTSHLFFGWLRSVMAYSLEIALILFFVFLIGGIRILHDASMQDAMMNDEDVNPSCEIVLGDIGIAEALRIEVPCFTSVMSAIGAALYDLLFFCMTYFLTSALLFGFMGKVSAVSQQLVKFGGAVVTPSVMPGSEAANTLVTMENNMMDGVKSIRGGVTQAREKIAGGLSGGAQKGAEKVQGGMKKMQEGAKDMQEAGKDAAEAAQKGGQAAAKGGQAAARGGAGGAMVLGGVVAAPVTLGASLKVSAQGAGEIGGAAGDAAEAAKLAAEAAAKAASATIKAGRATVKVIEGGVEATQGAAEVATSKKDDDGKKGDARTGIPGMDDKGKDDKDDGKGGGSGGSGTGGGSGGGSGSGDDGSGGSTPPAGGSGGGGSSGGGSAGGGSSAAGSSGGSSSGGGVVGAVVGAAATTAKATASVAKKTSAATVRATMRALPQGKGNTGAKDNESKAQGRPVKVFEMDWDKNADKEREIKEAMEEMGFKQLKDYESYDSGNKIEIVFKNEEDEKKFEAILNGQDPESAEDKAQKTGEIEMGDGEKKADEKTDEAPEKKGDSDEGDTNKEKDKEEDK